MSQQHDDDGTVIRPGGSSAAVAAGSAPTGQTGAAAASDIAEDGLSLRVGARLGEFEITQRIGEGGFSIVYLAMDHSLDRTVALKEYLPSSLATRVGSTQVQPRSQRYRDTFEAGLKSFVNEAKLLASFDHPSLVKVYRFWEANGTAYMVMPFYQGATVKETVRAMPRPPDEDWLLTLLGPLTEALMVIHAERCYHRDIAPDNVILLAHSAKPLLLDFGAARRVIGDMTQGLTVILKAGYAPVEQYAEIPGMKQGPWTDVYALAAVVYWAITGSTPPASVGRMLSDSFVPLARCGAGRYSTRFLETIDRALLVRPEQRTQTIAAFRDELGLTGATGVAHAPLQRHDTDATVIRPVGHGPLPRAPAESATWSSRAERAPAEAFSSTATPGTVEPLSRQDGDEVLPHSQPTPEEASSVVAAPVDRPGSGRRRWLLAGSVIGALAAAAGIWWALQSAPVKPSSPVQPEAPAISAETRPSTTSDAASASATTVPAADARRASPPISEALPPVAAPATEAVNPVPEPKPPTLGSAPLTPPRLESVPSTPPPMESIPVPAPSPVEPVPVAPPPVQPVPVAPPPPVAAKRTAPRDAGTAPPARERAAPRTAEGRTHERTQAESTNPAECARILQRLSLGESSRELLERLKVLKCQ